MIKKYSRQYDLINSELLATPITIIGAGGIGSWSTLALAKMGCSDITVQDMDTVNIVNTASQLYGEDDIKQSKVSALAYRIFDMAGVTVKTNIQAWQAGQVISSPIVISGLDNMDTRGALWSDLKLNPAVNWYIDGRMAGDLLRIYCVDLTKPETFKRYQSTIVKRANIDPTPCTGKAVVYNVFICAGIIANLVKKIAKGETTKWETIIDLNTI